MKANIKAVKGSYCVTLYDTVLKENRVSDALLKIDQFTESDQFAEGNTGVYLDLDLVDQINSLKAENYSTAALFDAAAAKLLWDAISFDDDVNVKIQMSDKRVWYDVTFNYLRDYTVNRWGSNKGGKTVSDRLFINGDMTAGKLIRHAVSRLWWYAFLTVDSADENKWHLLDVLCTNTEVQQAITDRNLAHNEFVIKNILRFLEKEENKELLKSKNIKIVAKWITGYAAIMELPMLDEVDFESLMTKVKARIL
ncbi:hypothetical protein FPF71_02615 [Algibacter amylolyticus]|uniref:Uncharacterized protein n=1 Tax=Algibacter amylolyticus TaxID=1608400 RepID=A0A5M7BH46_9FLAO|nr:DUF6339 family protein [Algibacter amylolyticus]KAA5827748.1 hypothetical protein F2B50_02615 [Algibacter amylolyticus]MBB5266971.1 hypothetical protein [Algibacter amylolyticus]TSJ81993.1 hypothetical protein FPF71_02615 [Algibacter amylolyticus]